MFANGQAEIGRVSGIPVVVDFSFILLALLWGQQFFTSGSLNIILMGLWIVGGVAASILIHELAHAFAARRYGVGTSHVELNGLGGLCYYTRQAPTRTARVVMALAGPASNLALYAIFHVLALGIGELPLSVAAQTGHHQFAFVADVLADTNFILFWFNLLPSHPLDGGTALANMMAGKLGYDRAMRVVAYMGMAVVAYLAVISFSGGMLFTGLIALYLFMHNQQALNTHNGPRWTRWN